jgi:hypothetical protein
MGMGRFQCIIPGLGKTHFVPNIDTRRPCSSTGLYKGAVCVCVCVCVCVGG